MNIKRLSNLYDVRKLDDNDIDLIYDISCKNKIFYDYHPPFVTKESIKGDIRALPPGKGYEDKYYLGFFDNDILIAIMDLILSYPTKDTVLIGFFMMNVQYQNRGIGSNIIKDTCNLLRLMNYKKMRIGVDKRNLQSYSFWSKNNFFVVDENNYIVMESAL